MNRPNRKRGKEFPRKKQPPGQEPVVGKELPGGTKKGQDDTVPSRRGRGRMRRCGEKAPAKKIHPGIAGKVAIKSVRSFLCLPKETNQRKGTRVTGPAEGGMPGVYAPHGVLLDAAGALQTRCAQTVQIPFSAASPVLGCVPMGIFPICPAAPRRRGREKTRELFEGEARVFPRPALGEK
jgi:hypothetical protein